MKSIRGGKIGRNNNIYYTLTSCIDCKKERYSPCMVVKRSNFSGRCRQCADKNHSLMSKGKHKTSGGYIEVKVDKDSVFYPMANSKGFILEHRLVMARKLGRCLRPAEVVHHKNHKRDDNSEHNLVLEDKSDHNVISFLELQVMQLKKKLLESEKERVRIRL